MKRLLMIMALPLILTGYCEATTVTHNDYQSGGVITASGQNANENAIINTINGNLDNTNISIGGILDANIAANTITQDKFTPVLASSITNMCTLNSSPTFNSSVTFGLPVTMESTLTLNDALSLASDQGTTGKVLISQGAGAAPIWTGPGTVGGYTLLGSSVVTSGVSIISVTALPAGYSSFEIVLDNIAPSSNGVVLEMRLSTGSGFLAGTNYNDASIRWTNNGTGADGVSAGANFDISTAGGTEALSNSGNLGYSGTVNIMSNVIAIKRVVWTAQFLSSTGKFVGTSGAGVVTTQSAPVDGVEFFMGSGNFVSGTVYVYGRQSS